MVNRKRGPADGWSTVPLFHVTNKGDGRNFHGQTKGYMFVCE
jgi:hypothetical protein